MWPAISTAACRRSTGGPTSSRRTERVTPQWLASQLLRDAAPFVLDVRAPREWIASRIDHSVNIPLNHLQERLSELPAERRILVHCAAGYRSSIAASLLQLNGSTISSNWRAASQRGAAAGGAGQAG